MLNCTIENELAVLEKYNLNPNEYFVTTLLLTTKDTKDTSNLAKFMQIDANHAIFRDILISLQDKGVVLKDYTIPEVGQTLDVFAININQNVSKTFFRASQEMGKELFNVYPQFSEINGMLVPLRSVSRHFNSLEDAFRVYGKTIRNNNELHSKIIELVKWGKDAGCLNCSLSSFIINNQWNDLEAIKDSGKMISMNFDMNTSI